MSEKKIKKMGAIIFAAGLMLSLPISVSAKTSSNIINGVTVTTTCNQQSSSHYIYKAYASGTASITYSQNGTIIKNDPILGTSQANYWFASKVLKANQYAIKATTEYSNQTVTASYQ